MLTYELLLQAGNLSFIPDASFDHAVSFAVMMYISDASMACRIASELVRIVKPGGKILIAQANDPVQIFKENQKYPIY